MSPPAQPPAALMACPVMSVLVDAYGPCALSQPTGAPPYPSLGRAIVYQQLSGKAAGTILGRVLALLEADTFPAPDRILAAPDADLRAAGLSRNKIAALKDLAARAASGALPSAQEAERLDDDALIERLTDVRGVGRWTAQMYLMSALGRPDVWPIDDQGVRNGWAIAYALDAAPTPKALEALGEQFRPHRSAAAWFLWRAADLGRPNDARLP